VYPELEPAGFEPGEHLNPDERRIRIRGRQAREAEAVRSAKGDKGTLVSPSPCTFQLQT
jgi:hypothetical protein